MLQVYFKILHNYVCRYTVFNINHKSIIQFYRNNSSFQPVIIACLFSQMSSNIFLPHPSLPVYLCFSSISLTRRPIMQGQRPSGNPPLRLHAKPSASNICACVIALRVKYERISTTHVGNRTFNVRAPWQLAGKKLGNGRFFYRFLVNNSNFLVLLCLCFLKICPWSISKISARDINAWQNV